MCNGALPKVRVCYVSTSCSPFRREGNSCLAPCLLRDGRAMTTKSSMQRGSDWTNVHPPNHPQRQALESVT